jgi:hypothetical protein
MMPIVLPCMLHLVIGLLPLVVGPAAPVRAQLDIPSYVPCYPGSNGDLAIASPDALTLTVDTRDVRQTVHSFGAPDAWSIQFVGQ